MQRILLFPRFKYLKLLLLISSYILAYFLFVNRDYPLLRDNIAMLGYIGIFLAGILYTYGFTSGFATALIFIMSKNLNLIAAGIIGGLGSLLGDILIFEFVRVGFKDEIKALSEKRLLKGLNVPFKKYIAPLTAAIFIASPLPDEIGVSMLAASKISTKAFTIISYLLNTSGILIILLLGA